MASAHLWMSEVASAHGGGCLLSLRAFLMAALFSVTRFPACHRRRYVSPHSSQYSQHKILYSGHIASFLGLSSHRLLSTVSLHPFHVLQLSSSVSRVRRGFISIEPEISAGKEKRLSHSGNILFCFLILSISQHIILIHYHIHKNTGLLCK